MFLPITHTILENLKAVTEQKLSEGAGHHRGGPLSGIDQIPELLQRKTFYRQYRHIFPVALIKNMAGHHRQSKPRHHRMLERLIRGNGHLFTHLQALLRQKLADRMPCAAAGLTHQKTLAGNITPTQFALVRQGVLTGGDHYKRIGNQWYGFKRSVARRITDKIEIVKVVLQPLQQLLSIADLQIHFNTWKALTEWAQQMGNKGIGTAGHRQAQAPRLHSLQFTEAHFQPFDGTKNLPRSLNHLIACFRQPDPPPYQLVQRHIDTFGEFAQVRRSTGLGKMQLLGGADNAAALRHAQQNFQTAQSTDTRRETVDWRTVFHIYKRLCQKLKDSTMAIFNQSVKYDRRIKMMTPRTTALAIAALLFGAPALSADVTVSVSKLASDTGALVVQVYDSKDTWLSDDTVLSKRHILSEGDAGQTIVIPIELKPGRYALSVYHDENNNEKLDANFIGIPKEPVGLSNDHRPKFGPPSYDKAGIEIGEGSVVEILLD